MYYIITYDIPDDKRRVRMAKTLLDFGHRVQYSVFEARLTMKLFDAMKDKIKKHIDEKEDSVRIYSLCSLCEKNIQIQGLGKGVEKNPDLYVL